MPSSGLEVRLPLDQRILFCECCEKIVASPDSLLEFCTAYKQDTFSAYDQSYSFAQSAVQTVKWS